MRFFLSIIGLCLVASVVHADEPTKVEIEGEPDITGHNYEWRVTNRYKSPIVYLEFPHWHADIFTGPDGWSTKDSTYLVNVDVPDLPGIGIAKADSTHSIRRGSSASFYMRVAPKGADRGTGQVKVRFEDGTVEFVPNVHLPTAPPEDPYKHVPMIALFLLFLGFVAVKTWRQRRGQQSPPA
jgi:hypothetical protein